MTPVLGQWANAPLALVLAQVRFETFMDLNAVAVPFRERIEKVYPRVHPMQLVNLPLVGVVGAAPATPKGEIGGYVFSNAENTKSVTLDVGALTYAVTSYAKYEAHFENDLGELIAAVSSIKELFVKRIGLRYIDFIVPSDGASPEDYVLEPFGRAPVLDGAATVTAFNLFDFAMSEGRMRVQYGRGADQPELPPDLRNLDLAHSPIMTRKATGPTAILDTDRWGEPSLSMPAADIMASFSKVHKDMSSAFQRIISPRARKEWGAQ